MKSIFFILGLLITFGAVGTMDYDPTADILLQTALALIGVIIMAFSVPSSPVDQ